MAVAKVAVPDGNVSAWTAIRAAEPVDPALDRYAVIARTDVDPLYEHILCTVGVNPVCVMGWMVFVTGGWCSDGHVVDMGASHVRKVYLPHGAVLDADVVDVHAVRAYKANAMGSDMARARKKRGIGGTRPPVPAVTINDTATCEGHIIDIVCLNEGTPVPWIRWIAAYG